MLTEARAKKSHLQNAQLRRPDTVYFVFDMYLRGKALPGKNLDYPVSDFA